MRPTQFVSTLLAAIVAGCAGQVLDSGDEASGPGLARDGDNAAVGARPGGGSAGAPGNAAAPSWPAAGACATGTLPAPRIWRLTHRQYARTLQAALRLAAAPDVSSLRADSVDSDLDDQADRLAVSPPLAQDYFAFTDQLVRTLDFTMLLPCSPANPDDGCIGAFISAFGRRAWRRPLDPGEGDGLKAYYAASRSTLGVPAALQLLVQRFLMSPHFLYRTELGAPDPRSAGRRVLTAYEVASELAYLANGGPPDDMTAALADAGSLLNAGAIEAEARRLAATPAARDLLLASFESWLGVADLTSLPPKLHPLYSPTLMSALELETRTFVADALGKGDGSLRSMLTAGQSFANAATAKVYGVAITGTAMQKVALDPTQRLGLLTQPAVLAAHSHQDTTGAVARGRFLAEKVLCTSVPDPPQDPDFQALIADFNQKILGSTNLTERQRWAMLPPTCATCHRLFGNLGLALESYDQLGKYRSADAQGRPIDARGTVYLDDPQGVEVATAVDLAGKIASGKQVYACFERHAFEHAFGREITDDDACALQTLDRTFTGSGYDVRGLTQALAASAGFLFRRNFAMGDKL